MFPLFLKKIGGGRGCAHAPRMYGEFERLPVSDADILLYRDVDLGLPPERLLARPVDDTSWRCDTVTLWGGTYRQPGLTAWHGDPGATCTCSGIALEPLPWTPTLGATRTLTFRHRRERLLFRMPLHSASLLLMRGASQQNWKHDIDQQRQACGGRINLTFRRVFTRLRPPPEPRASGEQQHQRSGDHQ